MDVPAEMVYQCLEGHAQLRKTYLGVKYNSFVGEGDT
jgi:hypothetical protein